jgi:hypothetical protein
MAALFGLQLNAPLTPNVDIFCNPAKNADAQRTALNAIILSLNRGSQSSVSFQQLISGHLGSYLTNRGTLLCMEVLTRLPELNLSPPCVTSWGSSLGGQSASIDMFSEQHYGTAAVAVRPDTESYADRYAAAA